MNTSLVSGKQMRTGAKKEDGIFFSYLYRKAFENSLLANIIFRVDDGNIIGASKTACKLLGYSKRELLTRTREDIFKISEVSYTELFRHGKGDGGTKADLLIIRKNGKLLPCEITSVIFEDTHGFSASVMSMVDLSEQLLEKKQMDAENENIVALNMPTTQSKADFHEAENNDWIRFIAETSYDVTWDWDITTNLISFGKSYEKVFGYKLPKYKISFDEWMHFFRTSERDILRKKIFDVFRSEKMRWEATFQFMCPDRALSQVIIRTNIVRDSHGKAIRMIGVIHDISKLQKLEGMLEQESRTKQIQIIEAIVEAKEMERSDLGKELHDNVNQLLGVSMLYLDMARKDMLNGDIYLAHSSEYTHAAIEEIRKLTKGLTIDPIKDFGLSGAIEQISQDMMETHPVKIHQMVNPSAEGKMSDKFKLNIFRILQEQLNNILKHAQASNIYITISQTDTEIKFSITDDGVGFDTALKSKGIGISNIISRAELYKGKAHFISGPGNGCKLLITFPIGDILF